jgi:sulfhydrogenase subunit delta
MPNKKPKIAIVSLTDCEGCMFAILDQGEKFFELTKKLDVAEFHLIEDLEEKGNYDIAFIEGPPITKENFNVLKSLRKRSKYVAALGGCAAEGGVNRMKDYHKKTCDPKYVYKNPKGIFNPKVQAIDEIIQVDFKVPGCPINGEEFIKQVYELLQGRIPQIPQRPVCYECQIRKIPCLLQKGEPCLGPIILGGCDAVCPNAGMVCQGCRGPLDEIDPDFKKTLRKITTPKRIEELTEIYGIKDKVKDKLL